MIMLPPDSITIFTPDVLPAGRAVIPQSISEYAEPDVVCINLNLGNVPAIVSCVSPVPEVISKFPTVVLSQFNRTS